MRWAPLRWLGISSLLARKAWLNKRTARVLVIFALIIKLVIVVWNAGAYNNLPYDYHWHKGRAAAAGLRVGKMEYNPPLYYLPCLPYVKNVQKARMKKGVTHRFLINVLRYTNVPYSFIFYLCWIFVILPRVIPEYRAQTIASLVLLGFPGFQKLAVMSHPDNLIVSLSALGLSVWLWMSDKKPTAKWLDWLVIAGYGILNGMVGMTRPFAAVPVFVLWLAGTVVLLRRHGLLNFAFISRAVLMTTLAGTISLSWYMYRWHETGKLGASYNERWVGPFAPYRKKLDYTHYFTSFYFKPLLKEPNILSKAMAYNGKPKVTNDMSNSFQTIFYSEFWGDHWLYFSSSKWRKEEKLWPKRMLFVVALPMLPLLGFQLLGGIWAILRRAIRGHPDRDQNLILLLYGALGVGLFMYWLMGDALLPGANTPIKFIYNAHIVPVLVTIAFIGKLGARRFNAWLAYALLVYAFALPVATFWPTG